MSLFIEDGRCKNDKNVLTWVNGDSSPRLVGKVTVMFVKKSKDHEVTPVQGKNDMEAKTVLTEEEKLRFKQKLLEREVQDDAAFMIRFKKAFRRLFIKH